MRIGSTERSEDGPRKARRAAVAEGQSIPPSPPFSPSEVILHCNGETGRQRERVAFEKHLLVDAANVIHAWPELRSLMKRDRDAARSQLVQRVGAVHDAESVRVTLVIDGRGPEIAVEHPSRQATLTVVYTPASLTADDVIEKMVGRSADASFCEVATADQAERSTIEGMGAVWVPPADLLARVERAERILGSKVAELNRINTRDWQRRSS